MADHESIQGQGQGQPRQRPRKMPRRRSSVYEHFTCFRDAQGNDKAQCKYCGLELGANTKNGTSNLRTHVKICKARDGEPLHPMPQPQQLELQPSGPSRIESSDREPAGLEEDEASRDLARMIALHGYDPSIVEDDYFRSFVRRLNPQFELPSREAIEKMCVAIFRDSRKDLDFSDEDGSARKVNFAAGETKGVQTWQVVYLTRHSIDHHWNLHRVVEHVYMALPDADCYYVFPLRGVTDPVGLDDNDYEVRHIAHDIMTYLHQRACNDECELFVVAGEITGHINQLKLKDLLEKRLEMKICSATYMDHVLHSIARCLLPDIFFAESIKNDIYDRQDTHKELLTQQGLAKLGLLDDAWEYGERWYSCYCCLEMLAQAVPPNSDDYTEQLLRTLWREIYRAIKIVSQSGHPTSNLCLQELFKVRDVLLSQLSKAPDAGSYNNFGTKEVADVLREALETVDKAIQDSYLVWSIPLILDPRYKLRYIKFIFERAFGSEAEKYVNEIRTKTKELYNSYVEDEDEDSDGSSIEEMAVDSTDILEQAWDEQCRSHDKNRKVDSHAEAKVELDYYLEDRLAPRTEDFDILDWWKQNSTKYPTVSRIAMDALAMPTCSKLTSDQMAQVRSMIRGYSDEWW
ncbi:unnamed protein product [Urochloa humidicola]